MEKQRYCICRSTDSKSFMIACDKCEEWFHGKCIKITPDVASRIKRYYCSSCQVKDPTLKVRYKKPKDKSKPAIKPPASQKASAVTTKTPTPASKPSPGDCGECVNCKRDEDCGSCEFCADNKKCKLKRCKNTVAKPQESKKKEEPVPAPPPPKKKPPPQPKKPKAKVKPKKPAKPKNTEPPRPKRQYIRRKTNENVPVNKKELVNSTPRQCLGPRCVQAARPQSKYCSDDCGMKLAAMRLVEIMPTRVAQWQSSPCVAEQKNRKQLDEIREKMLEAKKNLEELDERHKKLDKIVERGKKEKVKEEESEEEGSDSEEEDEEEDMELFVYCVTCGHEVRLRNAIKHMDRCFVKAERDMSFAGTFKSLIGGDTICDHYNASSKTYCKRLKVICPEHSKEPKVGDDEICGCPLTKELFTEMSDLCKNAKKHCVDHFKWERLRRAEIDAGKVRQWMKIDELLEKERLIRAAMSNRAGVLGLLLHQTVDHEALQTHHKLVTPVKSDTAKPATIKTAVNESHKNLTEAMEVDPSQVSVRSKATEVSVAKQQPITKSTVRVIASNKEVGLLPRPVVQTNSPKIVITNKPKSILEMSAAGKSSDIQSANTVKTVQGDHDYSQSRVQPAPSREHDYC